MTKFKYIITTQKEEFNTFNEALTHLIRLRESKFKDFLGLVDEMYPSEKKSDKNELTNKLFNIWVNDLEIKYI